MPRLNEGNFNFTSRIFFADGSKTWEDMPVGKVAEALDPEGRKNEVVRHTDIYRNYGPTILKNYFFVSPTSSSGFYEE
jgi:hypothetical protein